MTLLFSHGRSDALTGSDIHEEDVEEVLKGNKSALDLANEMTNEAAENKAWIADLHESAQGSPKNKAQQVDIYLNGFRDGLKSRIEEVVKKALKRRGEDE